MIDCEEAKSIKWKIIRAKTDAERRKLRAVLDAHRKSCKLCK